MNQIVNRILDVANAIQMASRKSQAHYFITTVETAKVLSELLDDYETKYSELI